MSVNKYICLLASKDPKDSDEPIKCVLIEEQTPARASKTLTIKYPDLKPVRITQEWVPLGECHRCGCVIFKGEYDKDHIFQRNGKNRCQDCR